MNRRAAGRLCNSGLGFNGLGDLVNRRLSMNPLSLSGLESGVVGFTSYGLPDSLEQSGHVVERGRNGDLDDWMDGGLRTARDGLENGHRILSNLDMLDGRGVGMRRSRTWSYEAGNGVIDESRHSVGARSLALAAVDSASLDGD